MENNKPVSVEENKRKALMTKRMTVLLLVLSLALIGYIVFEIITLCR